MWTPFHGRSGIELVGQLSHQSWTRKGEFQSPLWKIFFFLYSAPRSCRMWGIEFHSSYNGSTCHVGEDHSVDLFRHHHLVPDMVKGSMFWWNWSVGMQTLQTNYDAWVCQRRVQLRYFFSCRPPCLENEKAGSIRDRMFQPHSAGKGLHQLHFLQVVQSLWKAAQVLNTSARYTIKMREKQKEMICHKNIPMQHVSVTTLNVTKTLHIANINGCSPSSAFAPRNGTFVGEKFP